MSSAIADRRLQVATSLSAMGPEPYGLQPNRLRFSLGVSATDLKVPFHLSEGVVRIIVQSARQLAFLLVMRHRALLPPEEVDRVMLRDDLSRLPRVSDALLPDSGGPDIRATAEAALLAHPLLTGGVMVAWLSSGGGGRSLVALIIDLMRRALAEQKDGKGKEETPALVALMLATVLPQVEVALREARLPAALDRDLRGAAAVGTFLAIRLGLERGLREAKLPADAIDRVEAPLSALPMFGGFNAARAHSGSLYGCELLAGVPSHEEALNIFVNAGADETVHALLRSFAWDEKLSQRAELAVALGALRPQLLALLRYEATGFEMRALIEELWLKPGRLAGLLGDDARDRKEVARLLSEVKTGEPGRIAQELARALKSHSPKEPAAAFRFSAEKAREKYARCALGLLADLAIDRSLRGPRRFLSPRLGTEAEGGVQGEYEKGRLYFLSEEPTPILQRALDLPIGHFFIDVKDFTRRTALLGQAAMGDFLRREFYEPILAAARAHHGGLDLLHDKGGISLNNLLGDAASLSGQIDALVQLTQQLRRRLDHYEKQLQSEVSSDQVRQTIEEIEQDFEIKERNRPDWMPLERLLADREAAIARARGEGLEAGMYLAFGPQPLVIRIEDEIFGEAKVAIAQHINESARGTARSGGARARADAMLQRERERRGDPHLRHPFAVFIGQPFSMNLPPEVESAAREAVKHKDVPAAIKALLVPLKNALLELTEHGGEVAGDIYNSGAALSEEALLAFQEAVGRARVFRNVELDPKTLHAEIQQRYFFPPEPLKLVAAFHRDGRLAELFRYVGRALFKGLEGSGGVRVWELVGESGLYPLLAQHHASGWFRQG